MKIILSIQSISDLITNSSSELFCRIEGNDIEKIYKLLDPIFGWYQEYEVDPVIELREKENIDEEYLDDYKDYPDKWIEIDMPYRLDNQLTFYKAGFKAILDKFFKNQYKIIYNED